jgi:hypothetical protein
LRIANSLAVSPSRRERGSQRTCRAQLREQQAVRSLGKTGIVGRVAETEHFAHAALVHVGVRRKSARRDEAEDIDGATQVPQAALGQDPGTVGDK